MHTKKLFHIVDKAVALIRQKAGITGAEVQAFQLAGLET